TAAVGAAALRVLLADGRTGALDRRRRAPAALGWGESERRVPLRRTLRVHGAHGRLRSRGRLEQSAAAPARSRARAAAARGGRRPERLASALQPALPGERRSSETALRLRPRNRSRRSMAAVPGRRKFRRTTDARPAIVLGRDPRFRRAGEAVGR